MSALAPTLEAFFNERLITQRNASPRTVAAYRDTMRLLLRFAHQQTGKQPYPLDFADLDAPLIGAFLDHLEHERGNSPRTRNARLAAIHSLYRYAALRHPEHAATIGSGDSRSQPTIRAGAHLLPRPATRSKRCLAAPRPTTWLGRRDHALLLSRNPDRAARLRALSACASATSASSTGAHFRTVGKGRKERARR